MIRKKYSEQRFGTKPTKYKEAEVVDAVWEFVETNELVHVKNEEVSKVSSKIRGKIKALREMSEKRLQNSLRSSAKSDSHQDSLDHLSNTYAAEDIVKEARLKAEDIIKKAKNQAWELKEAARIERIREQEEEVRKDRARRHYIRNNSSYTYGCGSC